MIRAHRLGNLQESVTMKWSCEGEEECDGLKCQKIRLVNSISKSGSTHDSCVLWIAEQRNFLPIRKVAFTHRWSATIPIGESIAKDLREIKPGVWFPFNVETTAYNGIAIHASINKSFNGVKSAS